MKIKKKYKIIYSDCPWHYDNMKDRDPKMGGFKYPTMKLPELKKLDVKGIADKDCALFMWATHPKVEQAHEVIAAWGFKYITCAFVWVKLNPKGVGYYSGMGHWTNGNTELVLFAKRGAPKRLAKNVKQLIIAPRGKHSVKPPETRDRIVKVIGDLPRIELFAADKVPGWDCIGFDANGKDVRDYL